MTVDELIVRLIEAGKEWGPAEVFVWDSGTARSRPLGEIAVGPNWVELKPKNGDDKTVDIPAEAGL